VLKFSPEERDCLRDMINGWNVFRDQSPDCAGKRTNLHNINDWYSEFLRRCWVPNEVTESQPTRPSEQRRASGCRPEDSQSTTEYVTELEQYIWDICSKNHHWFDWELLLLKWIFLMKLDSQFIYGTSMKILMTMTCCGRRWLVMTSYRRRGAIHLWRPHENRVLEPLSPVDMRPYDPFYLKFFGFWVSGQQIIFYISSAKISDPFLVFS